MGKHEPANGVTPSESSFEAERISRERFKSALGLEEGESEALLEEAERVAQLGSWAWDIEANRVTWSENLYSLLEYEPALDTPSLDALCARVHTEDSSLMMLLVERAKHTAQPQSVALRLQLPRHGERHVLIRGRALRSADGKIVRVVGTVLDVTERRAMEQELAKRTEELAESEARWRSIAETPFDFIVLVDEHGVYRWVNRTAEGVNLDELIGRASIYDFLDAASRPMAEAALAEVFRTGEASYYEGYAPKLAGWFGNAVGAYKKAGKVELACILTRDISEAKRAEAEIVRHARMLAEAERIAHVGSWQWDKASGRLDWSEELHRIFGVAPETTPTWELYDALVLELDRARIQQILPNGFATSNSIVYEYRIRRRSDGAIRQLQTAGEVLRDSAGEVTGFLGATVDLTERKELEEKIARTERLEALGRLAGGLAHDFNNVLTVILGQVELAGRSPSLEPHVRESLGTIGQASERASRMTRQLLAFASRQVLIPRAIEPRAEIQSLVRLIQPLLGEDIRIVLNFAEPTWPVCVDPSQLEQLVMNLVINARDAMERGGNLTIATANVTRPSESAAGEWMRLTVADTGSGIAAEVRRHLFDPFFTTKSLGKGTGLGLATCENIVKHAGGFIEVESEVGDGAAFHVYLPRSELPASKAVPISEYPSSVMGSETILVVEDMALIRRLCARVLSGLGYTTLCAETAAEALEVVGAHSGPIHLILTDMVLPDRPGVELAADLLLLFPAARVLFTSGYSEVTIPVSFGSRHQFLPKPYTPTSLSKKIRQILDDAGNAEPN